MSQAAIAEIVKMMESVPVRVQERAVDHFRAYLSDLNREGSGPPGPTAEEYARAILNLPSLPAKDGVVVTSEIVHALRDMVD